MQRRIFSREYRLEAVKLIRERGVCESGTTFTRGKIMMQIRNIVSSAVLSLSALWWSWLLRALQMMARRLLRMLDMNRHSRCFQENIRLARLPVAILRLV